jgi:hypothetical protein
MGKIGDAVVEQFAVGGMCDGFIKSMGADSDGSPAEVVFADIDRVQSAVPSLLAGAEDLIAGNRVGLKGVFGNVIL